MLFTVESAKQFLLSKVSERAIEQGVPLDDIEKRMFLFSEGSGNPDLEANDVFDKTYDSRAYESKIAKLLRKAYAADKRTTNGVDEWKDALRALKQEDFYGLVMVEQAKIPRRKDGLLEFELEWLPFGVVEFVIIAVGFLVVFRPSVLGFYLPDWARWLACPLFIWLFLYIGRVWEKLQNAKAVKRLNSRSR